MLRFMGPVVFFSVLFNLPKFFEYSLETDTYYDTGTNATVIDLMLQPTDLRLNDNYVYYYVNLARLIVGCLFPFISLTILHIAIYR